MSTIRVLTNFNIDLEFEAAPFYKRLLAWLLDSIVLVLYLVVAARFLVSFAGKSSENMLWALIMLLVLPYLTYHLVCEITMNGQSIGKRIMRLKVVNENGEKPAIGQYVI